jgi:Pre-toxin TG
LLSDLTMSISRQVVQYGQRRVARKLLRAAPWVGAVVALATLGAAIRRKGAVGGTLDTALDFIPFVGGVKTAAEVVRGRDFIRDRERIKS